MKKTAIWIIIESDNRNIVYPVAVEQTKQSIMKYFGTRNIQEIEPSLPVIGLTCEVTQDDINNLKKIIDNDSIHLTALIGAADSEMVKGDIIDFTINDLK